MTTEVRKHPIKLPAERCASAGSRGGVSIRFRLTSLVVVCVLPVWIAAGLLVYYNYESKRALTQQHMLDTARALTLVVDRELTSMQASLSYLATSTTLDSNDLSAFYRRAQVVAKAHPGADIVLSDANGKELVNTFRPFGSSLPNRGSLEAVHQVFETGRPSIANVYRGAATERLRISVDVPVFRNGQVIYDLAMAIPPDSFVTIVSQQHLPPQWLGRIFDSNEILVARTYLGEEYSGRRANPVAAERMRSAPEGTVDAMNFDGVQTLNSFSRSATSGWTVMVGVPKSVVMAESWRWLSWAIVGMALLSVGGIVLALLMARQIARSIQGLISPALALGRGELVAIPPQELAEINEVGESLAKASQLIQQRANERESAAAALRETEDLKRLNMELERSEADARARATELAAIMDAVPALTFIAHDPECKRMTSSRAAHDLFQTPHGSNASQSAPEGERPSNFRILRDGRELSVNELPVQVAATSGREVREDEYTIEFTDGSSRSIFGGAVPLLDASGRSQGAVGAFIDISERKRDEEARRALEQQLRQSQKMEAVGRLAGGIAHDFNNLLMVIQSYTEMLQERLPDHDTFRNNTMQIMKAAKRAASLTGQMLAFSRKQIISPVVLDLNAVIRETAKMLERLIGEDIDFRVVLTESLWTIRADPDQIVQVLMNLCVNSRDAMPQGGALMITTENVTVKNNDLGRQPCISPGDYVTLTVSDTGTGISKELQERIFEPFFTTKEVGKGSGLGLAMVYGIVKQAGGYVWLDSQPGVSTSFTVHLPAAKAAVAPEVSVKATTLKRGSENILVVEDEEALREAICEHLRNLGYTVFAAGSGHDALSIASELAHINLLITDVVMPKMSGRELSATLGSRYPNLKTIYMSGYTDDAVLRNGIHESGANFLQKPFSLDTLAGKLRDTLRSTEPIQ